MDNELIIEHYKYPLNKGKINNYSSYQKQLNPSCGDIVEIYLKIEKDKITDIKWEGQGCSISLASTSIISEYIKNKDLNEILNLNPKNIEEILGIQISYRRIMCANLALLAIKNAIYKYQNKPEIGFNELLSE